MRALALKSVSLLLATLASICATACARAQDATDEQFGKVHFQTTCNEVAQRRFDRGMPRPARRHTPTHAAGRPLKITFGQMREMGLRGVLILR